jgi:hypothetical protein
MNDLSDRTPLPPSLERGAMDGTPPVNDQGRWYDSQIAPLRDYWA